MNGVLFDKTSDSNFQKHVSIVKPWFTHPLWPVPLTSPWGLILFRNVLNSLCFSLATCLRIVALVGSCVTPIDLLMWCCCLPQRHHSNATRHRSPHDHNPQPPHHPNTRAQPQHQQHKRNASNARLAKICDLVSIK